MSIKLRICYVSGRRPQKKVLKKLKKFLTKQIRDDIINKSLKRKRIRFGEGDRTLKIKQHDQLMTRNYFEKRLRGNTSEATLKNAK